MTSRSHRLEINVKPILLLAVNLLCIFALSCPVLGQENRRTSFYDGPPPTGKPSPDIPLARAFLTLPSRGDYRGFGDFQESQFEAGDEFVRYRFAQSAFRLTDRANVMITVSVVRNLGAAKILTDGYAEMSNEIQPTTLTGRKIGEKAWASIHGEQMMVQDGFCLIRIILRRPVGYVITQEDKFLLERLTIQTLDRLTTLGLTSRPKEQASTFARQQMTERVKALPAPETKTGPAIKPR